jgi:hypothetical protein
MVAKFNKEKQDLEDLANVSRICQKRHWLFVL